MAPADIYFLQCATYLGWSHGQCSFTGFVQCSAIHLRAYVGDDRTSRGYRLFRLIISRETAAEENSTAYFPLLDRIAEGRFAECSTDQDLYNTFLQVVKDDGHITNPDALSSFQFALSIHSAAPRIEANYHYYDTSVEPSLMVAQDAACPVWVHFDGKQYCSPALNRAQQDVGPIKYGRALAVQVPLLIKLQTYRDAAI